MLQGTTRELKTGSNGNNYSEQSPDPEWAGGRGPEAVPGLKWTCLDSSAFFGAPPAAQCDSCVVKNHVGILSHPLTCECGLALRSVPAAEVRIGGPFGRLTFSWASFLLFFLVIGLPDSSFSLVQLSLPNWLESTLLLSAVPKEYIKLRKEDRSRPFSDRHRLPTVPSFSPPPGGSVKVLRLKF